MGCYVITGATGGIGKATAQMLLQENKQIVVTGRNAQTLIEIYGDHKNANVLPWDLSDTHSLDDYVKHIVSSYGAIRGFVHAAGIDKMCSLMMNKIEDMQNLMNLHAIVPLKIIGQIAKRGNFDEHCSIVLISSLAGREGSAGHTAYSAAKGALDGFLKSGACELSQRGIRLNIVVPGIVKTEMSDMNFAKMTEEQQLKLVSEYPLGIGMPEDVANAISFYLSNKSKWITGTELVLDGGHMARKA